MYMYVYIYIGYIYTIYIYRTCITNGITVKRSPVVGRAADQHRVRANDQYRLDLADAARDAHL